MNPITRPQVRVQRIITDKDQRFEGLQGTLLEAGYAEAKAPSALKADLARDLRRTRSTAPVVKYSTKTFKKWARIQVDSVIAGDKLTIDIEVVCNPEHMCVPHDLVPVFLEKAPGSTLFMVALLEPTVELNCCTFQVTYGLRDIAALLNLPIPSGTKPEAAIRAVYPEFGVTAQWLADTAGVNGPNHVSGGVIEKGGSGKILMRERTVQDYRDSEVVRNTEWNMAERLTPGRARPVYQAYQGILAPGEELATTLEAESEFEVDPAVLSGIIGHMDDLCAAVKRADEAEGEAIQRGQRPADRPAEHFGIVSMTKSTKVYTDHYFDLVMPDDTCTFPLLNNKIVLRRRIVAADDPAGTYLFCLKGRSKQFGKERLRLATQCNLIEDVMLRGDAYGMLWNFMCDDTIVDNAFARVFIDVLTDRGMLGLLTSGCVAKPVFTVESHRTKYSMKYLNGTVIEFSADRAMGTLGFDPKARKGALGEKNALVCSFELGVGHPGLTAGNTATMISMDKRIAQFNEQEGIALFPGGSMNVKDKMPKMQICRPYHIPPDLDNGRLVQKADFKLYMELRDHLITEVFRLSHELRPGGNKASTLLEMINKLG